MNDRCQAWMALSDRVAAGEPVTASELSFQREHGSSCNACRGETRLWNALQGALDDPTLLTTPLAAASRDQGSSGLPPRWSPQRWTNGARARLALLAALSGALVSALVLWKQSATSRAPEPASKPAIVHARMAFVSGDARINQRPATAGQQLVIGDLLEVTSGHACLLVPPAVTVCANERTTLVVEKLGVERRLGLRRGHALAKLEPQPAGTSFGFETDAGTLVAKGTVFAVEVTPLGGAVLRVHEGTVVSQRGSRRQAFVAPAAARLAGTPEAEALGGENAARDTRLIQLAGIWPETANCTLDVSAAPQAGDVALDGTFLGRTPLTALVRAGNYRLTLERHGFAPIAERVATRPSDRIVRNYELSPLPDSSAVSAMAQPVARSVAVAAPAPAASAAALLSQARELRAAGRFAEARSAYARLVAQHPRSDEARAALVSLGELQLTQFGDARAALKSFDSYLRSGGGLAQEARYGRIRALRKLGRHAEERAAIERFVADYPRSVQSSSLRARLSEP
jgi:hypothetical protein